MDPPTQFQLQKNIHRQALRKLRRNRNPGCQNVSGNRRKKQRGARSQSRRSQNFQARDAPLEKVDQLRKTRQTSTEQTGSDADEGNTNGAFLDEDVHRLRKRRHTDSKPKYRSGRQPTHECHARTSRQSHEVHKETTKNAHDD